MLQVFYIQMAWGLQLSHCQSVCRWWPKSPRANKVFDVQNCWCRKDQLATYVCCSAVSDIHMRVLNFPIWSGRVRQGNNFLLELRWFAGFSLSIPWVNLQFWSFIPSLLSLTTNRARLPEHFLMFVERGSLYSNRCIVINHFLHSLADSVRVQLANNDMLAQGFLDVNPNLDQNCESYIVKSMV